MKSFGCLGAQKLSPRRNIEEQIPDDNCGPSRMSCVSDISHSTSLYDHSRRRWDILDSGHEFDLCNRSYRSQGFPAEPERRNGSQILRATDLRGCVALKGKQRIVANHAFAVIRNFQKPPATTLDVNGDPGRRRIDCILNKLLSDRSWPLDHFAGGDLIGNMIGKDANF